MSDQPQSGPGGMPPGGEQELSAEQQEMLRQMEEEMRSVRVQDVVTQSVVSILNLAARRIGKEDERDLEQARVGIEAVRALVDLLEPEPQQEVRNALSQIQMMYAQHADQGAPGAAPEPGGQAPAPGPEAPSGGAGGQASRLWTPGS